MKKHTSLLLIFCSYFCFFAQEEYSPDEHVVDNTLFETSLDYFNKHNVDGVISFPEYNSLYRSDNVSYQSNNLYNNGGVCYQRIGRFSDEDSFNPECIHDVLAAAPAAVKKIIINLLYPPKNKAALPKRLLLVGKPGTGKTTLAKAIAIKCGYDYYVIEAPFLLNEYKNSGPQNLLREIYPLLESGRKVVVILDELTELTDRYKKENDSDATVAAALWILLDSCAQYENVFFIGTSNKQKKDLPAQLQSRFDEDIVTLDMPNAAARKRVLQYFLKHERHKIDVPFVEYLVKKTDGRSVREIEKLVCKAIQLANVRTPRRYTVTCKDFTKALALWKPLYHPTVIYEKIEPHLQPFFKTAYPIILQTIGLMHSIYTGERGLWLQEKGLDLHKQAFEFQKKTHEDSMKWQECSAILSTIQAIPIAAASVAFLFSSPLAWCIAGSLAFVAFSERPSRKAQNFCAIK